MKLVLSSISPLGTTLSTLSLLREDVVLTVRALLVIFTVFGKVEA